MVFSLHFVTGYDKTKLDRTVFRTDMEIATKEKLRVIIAIIMKPFKNKICFAPVVLKILKWLL